MIASRATLAELPDAPYTPNDDVLIERAIERQEAEAQHRIDALEWGGEDSCS